MRSILKSPLAVSGKRNADMKRRAGFQTIFAAVLMICFSYTKHLLADNISPEESALLQLERWGFLGDFIDKPLFAINANGGVFDLNSRTMLRWEKPGVLMVQTASTLSTPEVSVGEFHWDDVNGQLFAPSRVGEMPVIVQADGTLMGLLDLEGGKFQMTYSRLSEDSYSRVSKYNIGNGWVLDGYEVFSEATELNISNASQVAGVFSQIYEVEKGTAEVMAAMQGSRSDEEFREYLAELEKTSREIEQEKQRKRQARSEGVATFFQAMTGAAAAYSEVTSQSQQLENQLESAVDQGIQAGRRQYEMQQSVADSRAVTSETQTLVDHPATTAQGDTGKRAVEGATSPNSDGKKLLPTMEAIIACTVPTPDGGRFRCATPVNAGISGGLNNSLASYRTPEAMVESLSSSCPSPRKLPSSTHLVWGCGFGATNNSAQMDRSAGVDVKGRITYYCLPKETGCRRTTP